MLEDMPKASRTTQKIYSEDYYTKELAEARAKRRERMRALAIRIVQARFPESLSTLQPLIEQLTDLASLSQLLAQVEAVQTGAELLHFLTQSPLVGSATSSHLDQAVEK